MQPVSDLFGKRESTNQEAAECRGPESCRRRRGGETVLDTQGTWRETVRRAFEVFPSRSPYSPLLSLRPVVG